jgi:putative ABC transport system substrate-binding protein
MKRRDFITLLGGSAAAWPLAARAQQSRRVRRISVLMSFPEGDPDAQSWVEALLQGLRELNWTDGPNVRIDVRFGAGEASHRSRPARELVQSAPDVIVTGGTPAITAVSHETHVVPTVFVQIADPVQLDLFGSYANPGGNITGFTMFDFTIGSKWLGMLREVAPNVNKVTVLLDMENPSWPAYFHAIEIAAASLGVPLTKAGIHDADKIEPALKATSIERNGGLIVLPSPASQVHRELIIGLAARYQLPAVYPYRFHAMSGGLISYGVDLADCYRRSASYVDRILRGENPGNLPVQAPTKIRIGHKPQDRQGARPHRSTHAAGIRGRGDRIKVLLAAVNESGSCTSRQMPML